MTKTGRMFFSVLVKVLCLIGFVFQISQVSHTFFGYKTTSKVVLDNRDGIQSGGLPNLLMCMTYTDLLDLPALNQKYGSKLFRTKAFPELMRMQVSRLRPLIQYQTI